MPWEVQHKAGLGAYSLHDESAIISGFAVAAKLRVAKHVISFALDWVGKRGVWGGGGKFGLHLPLGVHLHRISAPLDESG